MTLMCSTWFTGRMTNATDLIRSVALVGGLFAAACGALVSCAESVRPDAPTPTTLPAVVVVHDGEPADVQPPQRLDVLDLDALGCADSGGILVEGVCQGVDY